MYRYCLDEKNEKNNPHEVRMINKIRLVKNPQNKEDYYVSQSQIDFGCFKDLVKEEEFDAVKEAREEKKKIEQIRKDNKKPKLQIARDKKDDAEKLKACEDRKEKANSNKSDNYIDVQKLTKKTLIDRIVLNDRNTISESMLRAKKKEELISIVVEIENMNIVK